MVDFWPLNLRITACDFPGPETGLSSMGDRALYEFPSDAPQVDLDRRQPFLPDNTDRYDLINEELPESISFYCGNVISTDERVWGGAS